MSLNEFDRRVLSHLSIPRNVDDLSQQLRTDAGVGGRVDPAEVNSKLEDLASKGWVVNLGEHTDMAKLAHEVERSKARTMPDEKAEIFSRRLSADHLRWRVLGDVWMYTDDGHEASRESTQQNVPPPMTTSQLRRAIEGELERVIEDAPLQGSIHDDDGGRLPDDWDGSLTNNLLPEEFKYWLDQVLAEHERVWGKQEADSLRKDLPIKGGSQFSDFYEVVLLDAENQKASITAAAPWYMALVETAAVTDADTGSTLNEPEYVGYARKSVAAADMNAGAGTGGSVTNANAIIFQGASSGSDTIIGFAHCVAATTGQIRKFGTCASTVVSDVQTPAQFAIGAYTTTIA